MKSHGIKITINAFLPVDKKSFTSQRDAYAMMASIEATRKLPDNVTLADLTIVGISAKPGGVELPEQVAKTENEPKTEPELKPTK